MNQRPTIIFDGVCNFCNSSVNFIIARDPEEVFRFTPMQSEYAQELLQHHGIKNPDLSTFLLVKNGQVYERTNAALEVTKDLAGYWHLLRVFLIVPAPIRDIFYNLPARNRYRLFGKKEQCMIPSPEIRQRFLE